MPAKKPKKKPMPPREKKRIATIKERHGDDFFSRNGSRAGKMTKTHFDSTTGSIAANKRWHPDRFATEKGVDE